MFSSALDLTIVHWLAKHNDGSIVTKGPQVNGVKKYELINRDDLDTFEIKYNSKTLLQVHPKNRTLVVRMKTVGAFNVDLEGKINNQRVTGRVWIIALLAKANESPKTAYVPSQQQGDDQSYKYDADDSTIYYIFENGKIETRTKFASVSPYAPLKLQPMELEHFEKQIVPGVIENDLG